MPTSSLAAFAAVSFVLIVIPGPSVIFIISRAMASGRKAALLTVAGNALGVYCQVLLVALGLGAIVARSITVFTVIKLAGAGYLVWLGLRAIRNRRSLMTMVAPDGSSLAPEPVVASRRNLVDGFVVGIANPKAIVFFTAILPQYVTPGGARPPVQMAVLGLVFVAVALLCDSAWGLFAGTARAWFARSPRRAERLGATGGVAMIGLGTHLAFTGRPSS